MAGEKTQPWCAIETDDYGNPTKTGNCKKDTCSKDKASKFARDKEKLLRVSTFSILACKVARGPHANKACKIPFDAGTHIANGCTISSDRNHKLQTNKTFHSVRMISKQVRTHGVPCREVDQGTGDTAQKTAQWTVIFLFLF